MEEELSIVNPMLELDQTVPIDTSIERYEFIEYVQNESSHIGPNAEIRFNVSAKDAYIHPHGSFLQIEGEVVVEAGKKDPDLDQNFVLGLFENMRYEINHVEIDNVRKPALTCMVKALLTLRPGERNTVSDLTGMFQKERLVHNKHFLTIIPLTALFGFADDYDKLMWGSTHQLILLRSGSDARALHSTTGGEGKIHLKSITWKVPHVKPNMLEDAMLTKQYMNNKTVIPIVYRQYRLQEFPDIGRSLELIWDMATDKREETASLCVLFFQTDRNQIKQHSCQLDDAAVKSFYAELNGRAYPQKPTLVNKNLIASLYHLYVLAHRQLRGDMTPCLTIKEFANTYIMYPVLMSHRAEAKSDTSVQSKIYVSFNSAPAEHTTLFAFTVHDKKIGFNPLTEKVILM
jgi:hypothetical protein